MSSPVSIRDVGRDYQGYTIRIETIANGYLVHIGCKTFAFLTRENMIIALNAYFADPAKVTADWENNKVLPE